MAMTQMTTIEILISNKLNPKLIVLEIFNSKHLNLI
jgi:hypothetical protein